MTQIKKRAAGKAITLAVSMDGGDVRVKEIRTITWGASALSDGLSFSYQGLATGWRLSVAAYIVQARNMETDGRKIKQSPANIVKSKGHGSGTATGATWLGNPPTSGVIQM